ncbi:unnamed protein product [Mytilus edulis]|uniref:Uncharacterized protein n=1 Tax=Mytilus edulis TaxID=6550 RepID=A0A8S3Q199_MYTED|nr:unnamed protein product [Mytilus edulis]
MNKIPENMDMCLCKRSASDFYQQQNHNYSKEERQFLINERIKMLEKELKIDKSKLSSTRRRNTCAEDDRRFYPEARTENDELYKKSSLFSLRHGINKHLSNFDSGKDIVHDTDFKDSNKVFLLNDLDIDIAPKVDEKNNISTTDHYNKENINSSRVQNLQSVNIDNKSICNRTVNYMDQRFPMPVLNNCSNRKKKVEERVLQ